MLSVVDSGGPSQRVMVVRFPVQYPTEPVCGPGTLSLSKKKIYRAWASSESHKQTPLQHHQLESSFLPLLLYIRNQKRHQLVLHYKNSMESGTIVNGVNSRSRTPSLNVNSLSLTEYSSNPSPPSSSPRSKVKGIVPEEDLLPNGYPDVRLIPQLSSYANWPST